MAVRKRKQSTRRGCKLTNLRQIGAIEPQQFDCRPLAAAKEQAVEALVEKQGKIQAGILLCGTLMPTPTSSPAKSQAATLPGAAIKAPVSKHRAADVAYDTIENLIVTLQLQPGAPIVESELMELTGLGRTPLREALMRMSSNGLIVQLPRRGLIISDIAASEHITLLETRRVLERLIAASAARRATPPMRQSILDCGQQMLQAAQHGELNQYMQADQVLDHVIHNACRNPSAVAAVVPLIIQCRRFWYAYQHEADIEQGARLHLELAQAIAESREADAVKAADALIDYLENLTRRIISS